MFQISETADLAGEVNNVFLVILAICVTLLLFITFLLVFFVIKYNSKRNVKPVNIKGNVPLEIIWTVVPIFLVLGIFYYGWVVYRTMRDVPKDAMNVNVTARMWSWSFKYENGVQTDTLYIPVAKPVKISLNALDVTHSFYVPAFRVKQDAVPGMETYLWFQPQVLGSYDVLCAEYCGERHSYMMSKVVVMNENDFNEWYSQKGEECP